MMQANIFGGETPLLPSRRTAHKAPADQGHGQPVQLSDEQKAIVIAPLRQRTKIRAFAGTGKTTTLEHKARHHAAQEGRRGLYLAFNKSAQTEAQQRFGTAAICKTTHGVAFAVFGRKYAHKLREMRPKEIVDMGVTPDYTEARLILGAIQEFCVGADMAFPKTIRLGPLRGIISDARAVQLRDLSAKLWESMCDPSSAVPMPHDGYLKLFQLSRPRLPGDYLMVDEFQDTNPVVLDIVMNQPQPVIVVGDEYQAIYGWRGAVNAMQNLGCQFGFSLTHSRRFGPAVAEVANELLGGWFGEKEQIVGAGDPTALGSAPQGVPLAVITRTNAELFEHAVAALDAGQRMAFIGGVQGYNFQQLIDVQHVANACHSQVKDPFLRSFSSKWQMAEYAQDVQDYQLQRIIKTCDEYGDGIFELVERVHAAASPQLAEADRILSTAHKSKGATLDHVVMGEDFRPLVELGTDGWGLAEELDPQEVNLTYVAVTRARKSLQLCPALLDYRSFLKTRQPLAAGASATTI